MEELQSERDCTIGRLYTGMSLQGKKMHSMNMGTVQ